MSRQALRLFLALALCLSAGAETLAERIDLRIRRSPLSNAIWGIHVEDDRGGVIYSRNGDTLLVPASVRKLFSAASAATCNGFGHTYRTELWLDGVLENGVLHGNLIVRGAGDPSLGSRYEARTTAIFDSWVDTVRGLGIRTINGGVVADTSFFDDNLYPGSWKFDNIGESWAPAIDALAFNENGVGIFLTAFGCERYRVTTDPWFVPVVRDTNCTAPRLSMKTIDDNGVLISGNPGKSRYGERFTEVKSVREPALYAAQAVHAALASAGVEILAEPRVTKSKTEGWVRVGSIESPPMYTLIGTMLESSSNLFAEMLYKSTSNEEPKSWEGARQVERYFLTEVVGVDDESFLFEDGSGLGVENYVSAGATVKLLRWMTEPSRRAMWEELLASPGESGTLERRLKGFEGRLWGKTGTLDGVRGLAGYLVRGDGDLRYFAIIVNNHSAFAWQAGDVIDQIVFEIDRAP
ncbi:MAG: D-alanyl-D-alanine carboxypeptidase/D-alanyl-D-alanine-endopeptidase [Thermoanaerobaculia bacterium]|nr:D-alanyl-D-alanine carboxypeptidase/D-alanyl-D-alanine-endopeptidase [Thermoanaerobaculia bacterium]